MTNIEKQNQEIISHVKGLERKCQMLERENQDLERSNNNLERKYNMVIKELQKQLKTCYTPFELAIKIVADGFEETLKEDYYKDWDITTWSEMQNALGLDSSLTKVEVIYMLNDYANKFGVYDIYPDDDGAIRTKDGDLMTYRQLTNEVRKELKERGLLNG